MDGYRWFQYGSKFIPRSNPVLKKLYFTSVLTSGHDHRFKRLVFFLLSDSSKAVVIHYVGDESIAVDFPHGNSKEDNSHVFKRTCPSVLTTQKILLQVFIKVQFQIHQLNVLLHTTINVYA